MAHIWVNMLSIFGALIVALLVCSITVLLSLSKPKGRQSLLARLVTVGKRYRAPNQFSRYSSTNSRVVDNKIKVQLNHEYKSPEMLEMSAYKDMYYKLHNLEEFPEVLPHARNQLIAFFAETLDTVIKERPDESILRLRTYSREELTNFMRDCDERVNQQWEDYVARRKKGGPLELFKNKDEARHSGKKIRRWDMVDGMRDVSV